MQTNLRMKARKGEMTMIKKILFLSISMIMVSTLAFAGGSLSNQPVNFVFTTSDDGAFIYFKTPVLNGAACGKNNNTRLAIKPSTPGGKAHLAVAMLAFSMGKSVTATGSGDCAVWSDTESLQYLYINP